MVGQKFCVLRDLIPFEAADQTGDEGGEEIYEFSGWTLRTRGRGSTRRKRRKKVQEIKKREGKADFVG